MQSNYPFKPRGIVKWHAFAALIDGEEQKDDVQEIDLIEKDLTTNQYALMNYNLSYAIAMNCEVIIEYLIDNKITSIQGFINKVDDINQTIVVNGKLIKVQDITNIII